MIAIAKTISICYRIYVNIKTYLSSLPRGGQKHFAEKCGISPAYLSQIATGVRPCPEKVAIAFERESGGVVRVEVTRPDMGQEWEYLRGTSPSADVSPVIVASEGEVVQA